MLIWYNTNQLAGNFFPGYVTNGPIHNLNDQFGNTDAGNANWDANVSQLGDSVFLVTCATMADDGSWNSSTNGECKGVQGPGYNCARGANERCIVLFQPTSGDAPKIGETFYDDFGNPYRLHKGLRQRNSNPGHVGGDKRAGGTNFMTEAFGALWYCGLWFGVDYFNSDGRFSTNLPLYATGFPSSGNIDAHCYPYPYTGASGPADDVSMGIVQTFSLNTSTLVQTPLSKAETSAYTYKTNLVPTCVCDDMLKAGCDSGCADAQDVSGAGNWLGYLGNVVCLDNGNFVSAVGEATAFFSGDPTREGRLDTVATIFAPNGTLIKDTWWVGHATGDRQWMNVASYSGGFCIRAEFFLYFYDNEGNLRFTSPYTDPLPSGGAFGTDLRSIRLASDIRSHYVYVAGPVGSDIKLGVWDTRTGAFVTDAIVTSDLSPSSASFTELAVDALDRVCVAYQGKPTADFQDQIMAQVLKFNGALATAVTPTFFPFLNSDTTNNVATNGVRGFTTQLPAVAMTTRAICIAAKGTLNSTNDAASYPDTKVETTVYTVFTAPVLPSPPALTARAEGTNVVLSWTWTYPAGFLGLQTSSTLQPASWSYLTNVVQAGNTYYSTNTIGPGNAFYRLEN
jgi:hypothetical protein